MAEECNVDDVLCKLQVLSGLKTIEGALGKDAFSSKYPEFQEFGNKIKESISSSQEDLRAALAKCGNEDLIKETIEEIELSNDTVFSSEEIDG